VATLRIPIDVADPEAIGKGALAKIGQPVKLALCCLAVAATHWREVVAVDRGCAGGNRTGRPLSAVVLAACDAVLIMPSIGKRVTASVPEHMGMCLERQFGNLASPLDHSGEASRSKWSTALGREHKGRLRLLLTMQPPEGAQFVAEDRMRAGIGSGCIPNDRDRGLPHPNVWG
jgi:hypothetical protein